MTAASAKMIYSAHLEEEGQRSKTKMKYKVGSYVTDGAVSINPFMTVDSFFLA